MNPIETQERPRLPPSPDGLLAAASREREAEGGAHTGSPAGRRSLTLLSIASTTNGRSWRSAAEVGNDRAGGAPGSPDLAMDGAMGLPEPAMVAVLCSQ